MYNKGFTLIELLVVIAIIGLLSTTVMTSLNSARKKGRDARRQADMVQLRQALEMYYDDKGVYPNTGGRWWGVSANGGRKGTTGANGYIPNLAPKYISVLPRDPSGYTSGWSGYLYNSNGKDYKLLDHSKGPESFFSAGEVFYDPSRPTWAWAIWSSPTSKGW